MINLNRVVGTLDAVSGGLLVTAGVLAARAPEVPAGAAVGKLVGTVGMFYLVNGIADAITGNENHLSRYVPRPSDLLKNYTRYY